MAVVKILISGANGFVARALRKKLEPVSEYELWGMDLSVGDWPSPNFYIHDLTQPLRINQTFDFVIHLAAYNVTHVGDQNPQRYEDVNVRGTLNILEGCVTKNFIFLSTVKVYERNVPSINEDTPLAPQHIYEQTKLKAEKLCQDCFKGEHLTILRSVNIVGLNQPHKAVIPVLFKQARAQEPLDIFGPAHASVQFLDVEDVVEVLVRIIRKGGLSGTYNVASPDHITLAELAKQIKSLCHSNSQIILRDMKPVPFSIVQSGRIEKALNWKPQQSITSFLEAYAKN